MVPTAISKNAGYSAWRRSGLLFALLAIAQFPARGGDTEATRDPSAPAWVKPQMVELSPATVTDQVGSGGTWDLLSDEQTNAGEVAFYKHYAFKFLSQNGVQDDSRLTISFDPTYETLTLNKLVVYRDGKAMDKLMSQDVKLLQREEGLDMQLYDGRLSAVMLLEDIRVGDVVEYAYTIRGMNPIFDGNFFDSFDVRRSTPLHRFYERLLWPSGRHLSIKSFDGDFPPAVTKSGPVTEYVWDKTDVPALISDGDLPSWYNPYQWVQLTEFQTWSDVNTWALKLFTLPDKAPPGLEEQAALLRPIADPKKRAVEALRFVQKNIRYLGIEVGAHSHKPYPIDVVLERRFGDCKDKALLLCALLHELGFEAYPALVGTDLRQSMADWLPTPLAFDHLTVQLRLGGRVYWLDPTMSDQGGSLDQIYYPDYGYSLVVKPGADSLTRITPGGYDALGSETTEDYVIPDFKGTAKLDVHTDFHGRSADGLRSWLSETSRDEIQKGYLNYYAKQYPEISAAKAPVFNDDFEKNGITSDQSYTISHFWQPRTDDDDHLYGEFYPQKIRDAVDNPDTALRSMPLEVAYPKRIVQTFTISFPQGADAGPKELSIDDPAFKYSSTRTVQHDQVTVRYSYETLMDHVDARRTAEYLKNVDAMLDDLDYEIRVDKAMAENTTTGLPYSTSLPAADARPHPNKWLGLMPFLAIGLYFVVRRLKNRRPALPKYALHRCARCGKTEHTAPEMEFRVARDGEEYCSAHLPRNY